MRGGRQMHLIAFLMTGPICHHHGAWQHPESAVDDLLGPGRHEHLARVREAGRFGGLFFAAILGIHDLCGGMLEQFGRAVVPLLQKQGVFRTGYAVRTLRENLRA